MAQKLAAQTVFAREVGLGAPAQPRPTREALNIRYSKFHETLKKSFNPLPTFPIDKLRFRYETVLRERLPLERGRRIGFSAWVGSAFSPNHTLIKDW